MLDNTQKVGIVGVMRCNILDKKEEIEVLEGQMNIYEFIEEESKEVEESENIESWESKDEREDKLKS